MVLITYGPDEGKLATIVDIVDGNKCLIDGPMNITGVSRQVISFKRINLTDLVVTIERNASTKDLSESWSADGTLEKWEATAWAQKLAAKKKRGSLNDFERFKVMAAKKQKSSIIKKKLRELKA